MTADLTRWLWTGLAVALWLGLIGLTVWRVRAAARKVAELARALQACAAGASAPKVVLQCLGKCSSNGLAIPRFDLQGCAACNFGQ